MRIDPFVSPCTKVKSKWIKDLHIKPDTLKIIEKKVGIAKTLLKDKRTSGKISMPDLKLYYRAIVIKTAWYWYSDRQVDHGTELKTQR